MSEPTLLIRAGVGVGLPFQGVFFPSFSPDGHYLAFSSDLGIYKINLSSLTVSQVTDATSNPQPGTDLAPMWSPDSSTIVFYGQRGSGAPFGFNDICKVSAAGGPVTVLTDAFAEGFYSEGFPAFTVDGRIVYSHFGPSSSTNSIKVMNADGSNKQFLIGPSGTDFTAYNYARPAPDGQQLAYAVFDPSTFAAPAILGKYVSLINASQPTLIIPDPTSLDGFTGLSWSPDSRRFAFCKNTGTTLWVISADRTNEVQLFAPTPTFLYASAPSFDATGRQIAFNGGETDGLFDSQIWLIAVPPLVPPEPPFVTRSRQVALLHVEQLPPVVRDELEHLIASLQQGSVPALLHGAELPPFVRAELEQLLATLQGQQSQSFYALGLLFEEYHAPYVRAELAQLVAGLQG